MASEIADEIDLKEELKNFLQFLCEDASCSLESVLKSSIALVGECPTARDSVLTFYSQLFDDYVGEYCSCQLKTCMASTSPMRLQDTAIMSQIDSHRPLIARFMAARKSETTTSSSVRDSKLMPVGEMLVVPSVPIGTPRKASTDSRKQSFDSSGEEGKIAPTPMSPTHEGSNSMMEDNGSNHDNINNESNSQAIIASLDSHLNKISDSLSKLINGPKILTQMIADWCLELAAKLCAKYSQFSIIICPLKADSFSTEMNSNVKLASLLKFWLECPVMNLLTNLIISTTEFFEFEVILTQLLHYSPHADWILAHLITSKSEDAKCANYIELLMQSAVSSSSVTCILAYLSEHNPKAIVKCSNSNISFLLKLCSNSKPLLELLAQESSKTVNITFLNQFASSAQSEDLNEHVMFCFLNAPNSFDLLRIAFSIVVHPEASDDLKAKTLKILTVIITHIHEFVYASKIQTPAEPPILKTMKDNLEKLVEHSVSTSDASCRRLELRLLQLLCVNYGIEFVPQVIHHILNSRSQKIDFTSYRTPNASPLLSPLLRSLRLHFGVDILQTLSHTLKLPFKKSIDYWAHLLATIEADNTIYLDIDLLTPFINYHNKNTEEKLEHFYSYYVLRVLSHIMEKFPKKVSKPRYRLCHSLVIMYFKLIDLQQNCEEDKFDVLIESIVSCQKCMSMLVKGLRMHQHIISKMLLELSFKHSELFSTKTVKKQIIDRSLFSISLLKENYSHCIGHSNKFRKIPLVAGKKIIESSVKSNENAFVINQQFVLDAFRACVVDMPAFTKLLIQTVSPDLIYNDMSWPEEDPKDGHLQNSRVTIEGDLSVARQFEANPLLWDLCDMIGSAGYLKNCMVIIRALMTVQRTQWSSLTAGKDNLPDTQKLLVLLSSSGILPMTPFKHIPSVLAHLQPWQVSYVLNDICKYLRDTSASTSQPPVKPYLERLRIMMAQNLPGPLYVKIFKEI